MKVPKDRGWWLLTIGLVVSSWLVVVSTAESAGHVGRLVHLLAVGLLVIFALWHRRRAVAALEASEARFRTLASATLEGVLIHDGETIVDANEQLAEIFGVSMDRVIGTPLGTAVSKSHRDAVRERLRHEPSREPFEFEAYRADGERFVAEVRARQLTLESGLRVAVLRDVTRHRQLEENLRQAQKMEAVGRFAGGIAHDFNNLLTIIVGSCDLANHKNFPRHVEQIRLAAERAAAMTRQLLAFSRQQHLELENLCLNEVVRETEPMLRRLLPKNIQLHIRLEGDRLPVWADRGQLGQVLLNLVINGRDAMPTGGVLNVGTTVIDAPDDDDSAVAAVDGPTVCLAIDDSGDGIEPEILSKIFDPFFTTKDQGEGTGLGLATVHGIVHQCGGRVEVDSQLGDGTRFRVLLPLAAEEVGTAAMRPEPAAPVRVLQHNTVLVVEDQYELGVLVGRFLEAMGLDAVVMPDAQRALEAVESMDSTIDLLIADVMLPGMSGPELADVLEQQIPDLAVLFMSGYREGPWIDAVEERPFLEKPFDRETFTDAVLEVLGRRSSRAS